MLLEFFYNLKRSRCELFLEHWIFICKSIELSNNKQTDYFRLVGVSGPLIPSLVSAIMKREGWEAGVWLTSSDIWQTPGIGSHQTSLDPAARCHGPRQGSLVLSASGYNTEGLCHYVIMSYGMFRIPVRVNETHLVDWEEDKICCAWSTSSIK